MCCSRCMKNDHARKCAPAGDCSSVMGCSGGCPNGPEMLWERWASPVAVLDSSNFPTATWQSYDVSEPLPLSLLPHQVSTKLQACMRE